MKTNFIGHFCNKCEVFLTEENCSSKGNIRKCKSCHNAYHKKVFQKHKDKHRELMYSWRKKNKDKVRKMLYDYSNKKFGSHTACCSFYMKKYKEQLTDTYVKFKLIQHTKGALKFSDIPEDLIKLKREQILLTRKIKNNDKEQNINQNN